MVETSLADEKVSRRTFWILAGLLGIAAFTGGSYQAEMPGLLVLRPLLIVGMAVMLLLPARRDWHDVRPLLILLAAFAATMLVQLVPLPPTWWAALPGHARYGDIPITGPAPWRPISLTPDRTINALMALLPALAVLTGFAALTGRDRHRLLWIVLALIGVSALVGVAQGLSGPNAAVFFYGQGIDGVPTGVFANRNHHAALLAGSLALLVAAMAAHPGGRRLWLLYAGAGLLVVPLVLSTGSRAGTVLMVVAAIAALALVRASSGGIAAGRARLLIAGFGVLGVTLIIASFVLGRALSIQRVVGESDLVDNLRRLSLPTSAQITADFFPFGIGHGAFEPVYRGYEPDAILYTAYLNRAHNDLLEVVMSGGLPALVVLVAFFVWLWRAGVRALRGQASDVRSGDVRSGDVRSGDARLGDVRLGDATTTLARAGLIVIGVLLAASLVDYPLRTGFMSMIFAICCCWLANSRSSGIDDQPVRRVSRRPRGDDDDG